MSLWVQKNLKNLSMKEIMQAQNSMSSEAVEAAPPFVWKPLMAVYLRGESFLRRTNVWSVIASAVRMEDIETAVESMEELDALGPSAEERRQRREGMRNRLRLRLQLGPKQSTVNNAPPHYATIRRR